jgi:hypothetical protein
MVDSLPATLHGLLAARLVPGLCLVQGAIGFLVAQGLLVKGSGREILVHARLWGHDRPFLANNMSEEGSEKEKEKGKKKEEEKKEKKEEETWLQKDETRTTAALQDPKALVEEVEVCSNAKEMRSKGEPTSSNASLRVKVQSEGNAEGSKAHQFRLDGCVDGLVCETVHDKDGPAIRVCKDDGFTSSQELPSPPEKESEDIADRVARLMKATKSDEAPVPEYIWNKATLRGLSFTPQQEAVA